ncbi:MAG: hypothetical protein BWY06_03356 [Candidatus Latescibacteria bacterium ADurb.Bin168]|nr:MAG: hypothetical protein BWY06_03356 [Candidatus Latescibacteria bacterium ADurb.Bin168]
MNVLYPSDIVALIDEQADVQRASMHVPHKMSRGVVQAYAVVRVAKRHPDNMTIFAPCNNCIGVWHNLTSAKPLLRIDNVDVVHAAAVREAQERVFTIEHFENSRFTPPVDGAARALQGDVGSYLEGAADSVPSGGNGQRPASVFRNGVQTGLKRCRIIPRTVSSGSERLHIPWDRPWLHD